MSNSGSLGEVGRRCKRCLHFHVRVCDECGCNRYLSEGPLYTSNPTQITDVIFLGNTDDAIFSNAQMIPKTFNATSFKDLNEADLVKGVKVLEDCEREGEKVLVYCRTGTDRSAAIVIGYLMKSRRWTLEQSHQHVKELKPTVALEDGTFRCLESYGDWKDATNYDSQPVRSPDPPVSPPQQFGVSNPNEAGPSNQNTTIFSSGSSHSISGSSPRNELITGADQATEASNSGSSACSATEANPNAVDVPTDDQ